MKILKRILLTFLIILAVSVVFTGGLYISQCGRGGDYYNKDGSYKHVESNQSFSFIMADPALKGFGNNILPWPGGFYHTVTKPLSLKFLLPKLGAWDPNTDVSGINYIIDKVNAGNTVFYSYYTQKDKQADPQKENTGLVFLKGKANAPFAIVIPGGGFTSLAVIQEGLPIAQKLNEQGYNVFVLIYRLGTKNNDVQVHRAGEDLGAAVDYVMKNADVFQVSKENYSLWGFSAGGRMTGNFTSTSEKELSYEHFHLPAPVVAVMGYPGMPYSFNKNNPPSFIVACKDDNVISIPLLDARVNEMKAACVEVKYTKYDKGGHGFGVGVGTNANGWISNALAFWKNHQK